MLLVRLAFVAFDQLVVLLFVAALPPALSLLRDLDLQVTQSPKTMAADKDSSKAPIDTAAEDALLQMQALHHTHMEATRLFLMVIRQGAIDAQICEMPYGKASRTSLILPLIKTDALENRLSGLSQQ